MKKEADFRHSVNAEWAFRELFFSWRDARMHKTSTYDEFSFWVGWAWNIFSLREDLLSANYAPGRSQKMMRKVSQGGRKKAYVLKFDIQGYFMSLPRKGLYKTVESHLRGYKPHAPASADFYRYIWKQIIMDDPVRGAKKRKPYSDWYTLSRTKTLFAQPPGFGIVIGNLTSQLLSNLYLASLDDFITKQLGFKYYGRYVDDFVMFVGENELERAKESIPIIESFLMGLGLTLHPKKRYIQPVSRGVEFLGMWVHNDSLVPTRRFKKSFFKAVREIEIGVRDPEDLASYLAHMQDTKCYKLCKRAFASVGWDYNI